jgi:hypothetical protein
LISVSTTRPVTARGVEAALMDSSPGQEGLDRADGPITGWVICYDGNLDAVESWQRVLDAESRSRTDEDRSPQTTSEVATEMLNVDGTGGMAAVLAAQVLETSFEDYDRYARQLRRREFEGQVQEEFLLAAERLSGVQYVGTMVLVENLTSVVTAAVLRGTFDQFGSVLEAGVEGEDWGWVKFELAEDAEEAVMRFGGVELDGQPMVCSLQGGEQVASEDY